LYNYSQNRVFTLESYIHFVLIKITCCINFKKEWPATPFFFEKEQVIFFGNFVLQNMVSIISKQQKAVDFP